MILLIVLILKWNYKNLWKAFDYMVYHTSSQIDYYKDQFPWLVHKSKFIHVLC